MEPTPHHYNILLVAYRRSSQIEKALALFKDLEAQGRTTRYVAGALVGPDSGWQITLDMIKRMEKAGVP